MLLKHYLDQGVSKAELARRFGLSRGTTIQPARGMDRHGNSRASHHRRRAPAGGEGAPGGAEIEVRDVHRRHEKGAGNRLNSTHRPRYLLSGLLKCGACAGRYSMRGQDR